MYTCLSQWRNLPEWFHAAYLVDWAVTGILYGLTDWIRTVPVFERDFEAHDSVINHPHKKQRVDRLLLYVLALYTPFIFVFATSAFKRSLMSLHHGCLSLWLAVCSQSFIVVALKNRVGRLRPDFLARCKWKGSVQACTGKLDDILDGRKSFPSGHSSLAFAGLVFLSLHIGSYIGAFRGHTPSHPRIFWQSRSLGLFVALSPLVLASWIAVTRIEDYRHHKEDVIVGGFIGTLCAYGSHRIYWRSPFSEDPGPRSVYMSDASDFQPEYELTRVEEPLDNV